MKYDEIRNLFAQIMRNKKGPIDNMMMLPDLGNGQHKVNKNIFKKWPTFSHKKFAKIKGLLIFLIFSL